MDGLGRLFNVVPVASGVPIPLVDADAVTFVGYEDGGATDVVITESKDASATDEQSLVTVTRYFTSNGVGGAWTTNTTTAVGTVEPTDDTAQDAWCFTIHASELSDGFDYVEATPDAGTCIAILHDLDHQAKPDDLTAIA